MGIVGGGGGWGDQTPPRVGEAQGSTVWAGEGAAGRGQGCRLHLWSSGAPCYSLRLTRSARPWTVCAATESQTDCSRTWPTSRRERQTQEQVRLPLIFSRLLGKTPRGQRLRSWRSLPLRTNVKPGSCYFFAMWSVLVLAVSPLVPFWQRSQLLL